MKTRLIMTGCLLCALSISAPALDRSDIGLYLSFDKGLEPDISAGTTTITAISGGTTSSLSHISLSPNSGPRTRAQTTGAAGSETSRGDARSRARSSARPGGGVADATGAADKQLNLPFDPEGIEGRAVGIENTDVRLSYQNANMFSPREGTISFWVKTTGSITTDQIHFMNIYGATANIMLYRIYGNERVYFQGAQGDLVNRHSSSWTDNNWVHVAFAFNPVGQALYVDGGLIAEKTEGLMDLNFGAKQQIVIQSFRGSVDEVLCFTKALTAHEVRALASAPPDTPRLAAPLMSEPVIDGKITSEKEWAGASALALWVDPLLGTVNADPVTVRIGHGEKALHVLFAYTIPDKFLKRRDLYAGSPLKVSVRTKDGDIYQDDYFGVCLSPPDSQDVYFFGINGAGVKRDEKNGDAGWNGEWTATQMRDDRVWLAEFSIPFALLGGTSSPRADWGVNFRHGGRQIDPLESVCFNRPRTKAPLAVMQCSPHRKSFAIDGLGDLAGGTFALSGTLANGEKTAFEAEVEVVLTDTSVTASGGAALTNENKSYTVNPGERAKLEAKCGLTDQVFGTALLNIKDRAGEPLLACYALPFVFSKELSLQLRYYPTPAKLEAVIDIRSSAMADEVTGATVKIVPAGQFQALQSRVVPTFDASRQEFAFDCGELPVGDYDVLAVVYLGTRVVTMRESFSKAPPPEWLGNKLGMITNVPQPWTPMKRSGRTIACWGRYYTLGVAGLPEQVTILGQDILAAPARLLVTSKGKTKALPLGAFKETEASDLRIAYEAQTTLGVFAVSAAGWIEFDGFMTNVIAISAAKPTQVDALAIEIPIKPEFAKLWDPGEYYPVLSGKIPQVTTTNAGARGRRIGDEERGLQFVHINTVKQTLIPSETKYIVRYEFLEKPTTLAQPFEITFGLQALPARPRSPLYRKIKIGDSAFTTDKSNELFSIGSLYTEDKDEHWNYLNFWDEQAYSRKVGEHKKAWCSAAWERSRSTFCMYLNITLTDANTPEYRIYRHEWAGKDAAPAIPYNPDTRNKPHMTRVDFATPSYQDFYMWYLDKTIRHLTDDGKFPVHCYLDNSTGYGGIREYMQRLYTVMKSVNPLNQVFVHSSGDSRMYAWSFADWLIEGEENTATYMNKMAFDPSLPQDYTKILHVDRVAARYSPFAFGDKFYLYQFWDWKQTDPARAHLWGLLFVHDGTTWAAGGPENKRALTDLGWDSQVEFVPYWRKDNGIRVVSSVGPVVASGWKRGEKNLLVMVLNDGDQEAPCELTVDPRQFGFSPGEMKCRDYGNGGLAYADSFVEKEPVELAVENGAPIKFEIGKHSFKLLRYSAP